MRSIGLVGLLLALLIVGALVKKQASTSAVSEASSAPSLGGASAPTARARSAQAQEAFKQSLDAAMQQQRAVPDEAR